MSKTKYKSPKKKPSPKWDLYRDGLSQSLMNRFIDCRETFRLYAVEGFRTASVRRARDFGTIYHKLVELHARGKPIKTHFPAWLKRKYSRLSPEDRKYIRLDAKVAQMMFEEYRRALPDRYKYIAAEETFTEELKLPNGKIVKMRGRTDELIDRGKNGIWIQENKTKQRIDMLFIEDTLRRNLQTMLYAWAMQKRYGRPVTGIVYNVIRQPSQRRKEDETEDQFVDRIRQDVRKRPSHYFQRRKVDLTREHHRHWMNSELIPLVNHICAWWESIKNDPFHPWATADGLPNPHHFARPFGIYSPMSNGRGDFYEYKLYGKRTNIVIEDNPFGELEDENDDADP